MKNLSVMKKNGWTVFLVLMVLTVCMVPELALASSNAQQASLKSLLSNPFFKSAIDLGLLIYAGYKWFTYFSNFNPQSAFSDILVPGVMTFLAFQWLDVLGWIKLV